MQPIQMLQPDMFRSRVKIKSGMKLVQPIQLNVGMIQQATVANTIWSMIQQAIAAITIWSMIQKITAANTNATA